MPQLAIEASASDKLKLSELWRQEPWARISSNTVYGIEQQDTAGEAQRLQARDDFIHGTADEPELTFPKLDMVELSSGLVRFDSMITRLKLDQHEDTLLFRSVSRKIAKLSRHRYVLEAMQAETEEDREKYLEYAEVLAADIFGDVEEGKFNGLVADLRDQAKADEGEFSKELLALLPDIDPNAKMVSQEVMTPETIAKLEPLIREFFKPAFDIIEALPDGQFEHEVSIKIFQSLIEAMDMTGVQAILTTGNALDADGFDMTIKLGRNRAKLTRDTFRTVGIHELIHSMGSYEGRMQLDDLASIGLPGSLNFEEGKCVAIEQVIKGKPTKRGEAYYLGLGLLKGTTDDHKRTFREVYDILWRRDLIGKEGVNDEVLMASKKKAYQTTMRITRGHAADTRDLSYYNGNNIASQWFNKIAELPIEDCLAVLKATLVTKADPTQPEHLAYLQQNHSKWRALRY